jgi:iron-sulfur cluster repair protein YtfE (RIC family)
MEPAELEVWQKAPVRDLIVHIMTRYHRECRAGLAELEGLAAEGALFEGPRMPTLVDLRDEVDIFAREIRGHLAMEETTLFPAILAREEGREVQVEAELLEPLDLFEDEHQAASRLLVRIHGMVEGYDTSALPIQEDLHRAVHALALSLRRHILLENEALFTRLAG